MGVGRVGRRRVRWAKEEMWGGVVVRIEPFAS